ncbi:hypothetical protein DERP_001343 [Dermatophagoides pteronyssinus]|uniref:Uncharacterized protein n=1 Tax=Dermatophagoides pteronyssinus TaxID=6956 RepID=A0ABQ8JE69_DERPT|nr:hypothetical protein DERP_001343 [Dermatophagoides pteronyssinus]
MPDSQRPYRFNQIIAKNLTAEAIGKKNQFDSIHLGPNNNSPEDGFLFDCPFSYLSFRSIRIS